MDRAGPAPRPPGHGPATTNGGLDPTPSRALQRGHAICLRHSVARASVPGGSRATRELVAGIVLGLICAAVIALLALFALGHLSLPRSPLPTYPPAVVEPRPTPLWPFRDEWLTPRPKA